jgi:hypothetical protein
LLRSPSCLGNLNPLRYIISGNFQKSSRKKTGMTSSQGQASEVVNRLHGLTMLEKGVAQTRLTKYYDGGLSRWTKQVEKTGPTSMGYVLIAYFWGTYAGLLDILGCALVFVQHKSTFLVTIEIISFSISLLLIAFCLTRWIQGLRVGKKFRSSEHI